MKKTLIIDGYNYIHANLGLGDEQIKDFEKARNDLIEKMIRYQAISDDFDELIIVFDGREKQVTKKHGITVIFTSKKKSADQVIEKLIASLEYPRNATLISNDNVSKNIADGLGARAFSTHWFDLKLEEIFEEVVDVGKKIYGRNPLGDNIDKKTRLKLDKITGRSE